MRNPGMTFMLGWSHRGFTRSTRGATEAPCQSARDRLADVKTIATGTKETPVS